MSRATREQRAAVLQDRKRRVTALSDHVTVTITISPREWEQAQRKFAPELHDKLRDAIERAERARKLLRGDT